MWFRWRDRCPCSISHWPDCSGRGRRMRTSSNRTAFLAEKVLGNVVSSGVKIMVLAVISPIASVLFAQFSTSYGSDVPTIGQSVSVVLASLSIVGLSIFGGSIANGLISGAPELGAGAAVGTGMAMGAMGTAAAAGVGAVASGGAAALGATAAAARGGAAIAGAANTAYSMGAMNAAGGSAGARMAAGLGGVAKAPGSAAANAVKSKMSSAATAMKQSYGEGARGAFTATGGRFTGGSSCRLRCGRGRARRRWRSRHRPCPERRHQRQEPTSSLAIAPFWQASRTVRRSARTGLCRLRPHISFRPERSSPEH